MYGISLDCCAPNIKESRGSGKFLTDGVVDRPGLPGCTAAQPTFYQLDSTITNSINLENPVRFAVGAEQI